MGVMAQRLATARRERPSLATAIGVFGATLLGFLAVGAVLPVLPRYVSGPVGAGPIAVGVVVGAFAFAAVVGRPVGGRLADARGRRRMVVAGLVIMAVAGALLLVPGGVAWLVFARLVVGVGDGWVFTAGVTWVVDLAPEERRGQAIGFFGLAIWGGLTFGALIGEGLFALGSYDAVWIFAALSPLAGALLARRVPDRYVPTVRAPHERRPKLVPRPAIRPGAALTLANVGFGTMAGFVVLHLADAGIGGGAAVFTAFGAAVLLTRLLAGTLPDRIGPGPTATGAFVFEAAGLAIVGYAVSLPMALAGGVIMGMGFSLLFPALALMVVSRVDERERGAALGAFTAFFDIGVGLGAPLAGAVAAAADFPTAFAVAAGFALLGAAVGLLGVRGGAGGSGPRADPVPVPG
jgi:MFS family permease